MKIVITPNKKGKPPVYAPIPSDRKLADAEIKFSRTDGPLAGLILKGFTIWTTGSTLTVMPPSWQFPGGASNRTFALLISPDQIGEEEPIYGYRLVDGPLKEKILRAYQRSVK